MFQIPQESSLKAIQRYFIELAFNGSAYHGWQIQNNAITVQEVLNKCLATVLRQNISTVGCGRTDTGVHARQLYVHFDLTPGLLVDKTIFLRNLNAILPRDIAVKQIIEVHNIAHARFDATSRIYRYYIHCQKDPFLDEFSWFLRDPIDVDLMNQAADFLLGSKDFSCFSKSNTQTFTNKCTIMKAHWTQTETGIFFHIQADRFLRNMVRAIVGTLLSIGKKQLAPQELISIINSKDRANAGVSVPACGLFLEKVNYPYI